MATFYFTPDFGLDEQHEPRILRTPMGDGYEQRLAFGLQTQPVVLNLTFANRSLAEAEAIDRFLYDHGGQSAFDFAPQYRGQRNLITWSQDFRNTALAGSTRPWINGGQITLTHNSGGTGTAPLSPIGDNTTTTVTATAGASNTIISHQTIAVTPNTAYTASAYVYLLSSITSAEFTVYLADQNNVPVIYGPLPPPGTFLQNQWWRYSMTFTTPATITNLRFDPFRIINTGAGTGYLWGAMVNIGSTPLDYQRIDGSYSDPVIGKYVCERWNLTPPSCNLRTITATFRQVFEQ
jgi:phage-related protein